MRCHDRGTPDEYEQRDRARQIRSAAAGRRQSPGDRVILRLVWENVRFRPLRTLLSILLIGVPVMLILTLVGVSQGFMEDSKDRTRGVGADIMFRPPGSSITSGGTASIREGAVARLAEVPHV